jgi:hypothetical protein
MEELHIEEIETPEEDAGFERYLMRNGLRYRKEVRNPDPNKKYNVIYDVWGSFEELAVVYSLVYLGDVEDANLERAKKEFRAML